MFARASGRFANTAPAFCPCEQGLAKRVWAGKHFSTSTDRAEGPADPWLRLCFPLRVMPTRLITLARTHVTLRTPRDQPKKEKKKPPAPKEEEKAAAPKEEKKAATPKEEEKAAPKEEKATPKEEEEKAAPKKEKAAAADAESEKAAAAAAAAADPKAKDAKKSGDAGKKETKKKEAAKTGGGLFGWGLKREVTPPTSLTLTKPETIVVSFSRSRNARRSSTLVDFAEGTPSRLCLTLQLELTYVGSYVLIVSCDK